MHYFVLRKLIDHLNISKMTLVCQDWGGLIGLTTVKDVPHMFSNLVIMNTGLPAPVLDFNDDNGNTLMGAPSIVTKLQSVNNQLKLPFPIYIFPGPSLYSVEIPGSIDWDKLASWKSFCFYVEKEQCWPGCNFCLCCPFPFPPVQRRSSEMASPCPHAQRWSGHRTFGIC